MLRVWTDVFCNVTCWPFLQSFVCRYCDIVRDVVEERRHLSGLSQTVVHRMAACLQILNIRRFQG